MHFSSEISNLKAFVHTSTFFVNNHLPRNTLVREQIYPLQLQIKGRTVVHGEFVSAMMSMQPQEASKQAEQLMKVTDRYQMF